MRRLTDDQLAAAVAAGDERAFGVIFERYQQPIYRYCSSILRDPAPAADALQNTMIAALRGLEGEERAIELRPWLYRIAHNQSISLIRRRRDEAPLEEATVAAVAVGADSATRERLDDLMSDLRELPDQQRSALLLRELSGLDYAEVATSLAITSNAARQAVYKARRSLQAAGAGREASCEVVQYQMSGNDRRFQRRRDISTHLDGCPDCRAFALALTQRPRDLAILFPALPAAAVAAMLAALHTPVPPKPRWPAAVAAAATLIAVALAASGVFDGAPKPAAEVAAAAPPPPAPTQVVASAPRAHSPEPTSPGVMVPSSTSGYSTPGERTEGAVAATSAGGANGANGTGTGAGSGGGLPVTGLAIGGMVAVALMLLALGLALRIATPDQRRR